MAIIVIILIGIIIGYIFLTSSEINKIDKNETDDINDIY